MSGLIAFKRKQVSALLALAVLTLVVTFHHVSGRYPSIGLLPTSARGGASNSYVPLEGRIPETRYVTGVAGFSYFENLYLFNGSFFFVAPDPAAAGMPELGGTYVVTGNLNVEGDTRGRKTPPGPDRWQTITPDEALEVLGGHVAIREAGLTLWFNDDDSPQQGIRSFLNHYYHLRPSRANIQYMAYAHKTVGEMFLGAWRVAVSGGNSELPARIVYRCKGTWRDRAKITPWFQDTILAGTSIQDGGSVEDRAQSGMTYLYEKIAISDRWAAHRHGIENRWWNKAIADLPLLKVPLDWMSLLRNRVVQMSDISGCSTDRSGPPVVTYIDRQNTSRRLIAKDHEALLESLWELDREGVITLQHALMEKIPRHEQFCMAARTDIMLGVHGNGMSHQLWMLPGAGVLEIMMPVALKGGFTRDYAILAELMSHEYYAIHNDTYLPVDQWRKPDGWGLDQGKMFHSKEIRVHGPYVASLVRDMAERRQRGPQPYEWQPILPAQPKDKAL